ncbi:hypothetical protein [Vibrio aerogenes]|uniref:hypothetical protein n=1 Tax=Vibrio aerogenes TaxID=92172 RepID=UPI00158816F6|nr:hypothetical protein [Vibrio aerogenes]
MAVVTGLVRLFVALIQVALVNAHHFIFFPDEKDEAEKIAPNCRFPDAFLVHHM